MRKKERGMGTTITAERVIVRIDVFSKSAKPVVTVEADVNSSSPGGPIEVNLSLGFPEEDIPSKLEIDCRGPIKPFEPTVIIPGSDKLETTLVIQPTFTDPDKHELEIALRHGIFYNTILPEIIREFSYSAPEITVLKVEAGRYRVLPGENVRILVTVLGPGGDDEFEIWGNIHGSGDRRDFFLEKRKGNISDAYEENYIVKIPEDHGKGGMDAEVFIRSFGEKRSWTFNSIFVVSDEEDFSLDDLSVQPECIFPGEELTVKAEITNRGTSAVRLSPFLRISREELVVGTEELGDITLVPVLSRDGGGTSIEHRITETKELETGIHEVTLEFTGQETGKKKCRFKVASGRDIRIIGATVQKTVYSTDEPVHLRAIFETGPRMLDGEFTAAATTKTVDGKVLARSNETFEIDKVLGENRKSEVEWVLNHPAKDHNGPVDVLIELFDDTGSPPLSRMIIPYMFSIKGSHKVTLRVNKESPPEPARGKVSREIGNEIAPFLFPGERIVQSTKERNFITVQLDNGTHLHLVDGKVITEKEEFPFLDGLFLYRIARNLGFNVQYQKKIRSMTAGILRLVENLIYLSSEDIPSFPYRKRIEKNLHQPGSYVRELINVHRKKMRDRSFLASPRHKQILKKRISSDSYVLKNLIIKMCKKEGFTAEDISFLFDFFSLYDDKDHKKENRLLRNVRMAVDRIGNLDPDFASHLNKNLDIIKTELGPTGFPKRIRSALEHLENHWIDRKTKGPKKRVHSMFTIILGLLTSYYLTSVIEGSERSRDLEKTGCSLLGGEILYNTDLAFFHLFLLLELLAIDNGHEIERMKKASEWIIGHLMINTKNIIRIVDEALSRLSIYGKNIGSRKMLRDFREHVIVDTGSYPAEGTESAVLEIPLRIENNSSRMSRIDMTVTMPGKNYKLHWPRSKAEGNLYLIEDLRLEPGPHEIKLRIELPRAQEKKDPDINVLVYGRRGNLIAKKDSPFSYEPPADTGSNDTASPGDPLDTALSERNEEHIPKNVIKHLIEAVIGEPPGEGTDEHKKVPENNKRSGLMIKELGKETGIRKDRLLKVVNNSGIFRLSEVFVKGGFLKLKTIVTHRLRFATTEELTESLLEDTGHLLDVSRHHPVSIIRVMCVYLKLLQGTKKIKKVSKARNVFTPGRPTEDIVEPAGPAGIETSHQWDPDIEGSYNRKIDDGIRVSGRKKISSIGDLIISVVEMDPDELGRHLMNDDFKPFFDDSVPGRVLLGAIINTTTQRELDELTDSETKEDLLRRMVNSPLEPLIFKYITGPKINNLRNEARGQAARTLSQLRSVNDSFTPPALSDAMFSLSKDVRPLVLETLGELMDPRTVPTLGQILTSSVEKADRIAALKALIAMESPGAEKYILVAISSNEEMERMAVQMGFVLPDEEMEDADLIIME